MSLKSRWLIVVLIFSATVHTNLFAQSRPASMTATQRNSSRVMQQDLNTLRDLVSAQQQQLETQHRQLEELRDQLQQLLIAVHQANADSQTTRSSAGQAQHSAIVANDEVRACQSSLEMSPSLTR